MVSKPSSAESAPNDLASFSLVVGALSPTSPSPHSVPTTLPCLIFGYTFRRSRVRESRTLGSGEGESRMAELLDHPPRERLGGILNYYCRAA